MELDVADSHSITRFSEKVVAKYPTVDILVNNAGIFRGWEQSFMDAKQEEILECFQTNTIGPLLLSQALLPSLKKSISPRIIQISSGMGGLNEMGGGCVPYRLSKVALNAVTKIMDAELKGKVKVNSMCPGYVKTDMTGGENSPAPRSTEQGAETAIWLALEDVPSGKFFRDKKELKW